jgi:hypothetical protein
MPLNPQRPTTKQDTARALQSRTESYLYRHAPVIASFLAGLIAGFTFGVR